MLLVRGCGPSNGDHCSAESDVRVQGALRAILSCCMLLPALRWPAAHLPDATDAGKPILFSGADGWAGLHERLKRHDVLVGRGKQFLDAALGDSAVGGADP